MTWKKEFFLGLNSLCYNLPCYVKFLKKCRNPTLKECEDETHIFEMGTWEPFETPKTSEFDYRGQNTLHWGVLYIIRKLSKCRRQKWVRMGHLNTLWQKEGLGVTSAV
jgi:hypothetical protein